jgi:hypothetical protein
MRLTFLRKAAGLRACAVPTLVDMDFEAVLIAHAAILRAVLRRLPATMDEAERAEGLRQIREAAVHDLRKGTDDPDLRQRATAAIHELIGLGTDRRKIN